MPKKKHNKKIEKLDIKKSKNNSDSADIEKDLNKNHDIPIDKNLSNNSSTDKDLSQNTENEQKIDLSEFESLTKYTKRNKVFSNYVKKSPILLEIIVIIITSFIRAIAISVFAVPNKLSIGGVAGITAITYNVWGLNVAMMNFVLNVPILILAFIFINKRFAISTLIATVLTSGAIELIEFLKFPVFENDLFVAALMSGALTGIATGMLLKVNSSTGGTDILGVLIQNKMPDAKVVWIIFLLNSIICISIGIIFKDLNLVIYSFVATFATSYAGDLIQRGFVSTFEFKIITKKPRQISDYVINIMKRSATLMHATGMYSGKDITYLVCVVRKRQVNELIKYIKAVDPEAFFYIASVHDIVGNGFDNQVAPGSKIK